MERWRDVVEFPGYAVSDLGMIYNEVTRRYLKPSINRQGHYVVNLTRGYGQQMRSLGTLVAKAFVLKELEHFDTILYLDRDKSNLRADNLMWRPRWFVHEYNRQFERSSRPKLGYPIQLDTTREVMTIEAFAKKYGLLERHIFLNVLGDGLVLPDSYHFSSTE